MNTKKKVEQISQITVYREGQPPATYKIGDMVNGRRIYRILRKWIHSNDVYSLHDNRPPENFECLSTIAEISGKNIDAFFDVQFVEK